jgi:hypothetical protein
MVGIYIYIDELIDDVLTPISKRIELFADETITITSSIQNFNDLGKIFTDYSKSFTVPASAVNNKIFSHWYENSVSDGFDQRKKYFGRIEIDDIPFRFGKFQLEKADKKDNMIESYTINFTGNLTQIKDRFKDDKLNSLRDANGVSYYNELNFAYTQSNVSTILSSVSGLGLNLAFPLIGSNRRYECGTGTGSDITTVSGAIDSRELFPAIPVYKIFEYIQSAYGLTFSGVFLQSILFKKLWLYLKNAEVFTVKTEPVQVDLFNTTNSNYFDLTTNELIFQFGDPNVNPLNGRRFQAYLTIFPSGATIPYTLSVYDNGLLYQTFENVVGQTTFTFFDKIITQEAPINGVFITHRFTFFVSSDLPFTFYSQFIFRKDIDYFPNPPSTFAYANNLTPINQSTTSNLNIQNYVPDMTVESFLIGIMKAHNLMIIPLNETSFEFITMDAYFERGRYLDITKYCKTEDEQISKPRIFKTIKFAFEKSENIINNAFRGLFNRDYGDLNFTNENISSTEVYDVKLPFEDIMYERYIPPITDGATVTNFVTATLWNKDQQAYTPKPVLMYLNSRVALTVDNVTTPIKYTFGGSSFNQTFYKLFTNEIQIAGSDGAFLYGFNFTDEVGVVDSSAAPPKGLYSTYYANYVENLYNIRTRKVTVKAMLNTLIVNTIQLYDRIIYKNKRYTINTMTVDLTTKETTFELLSDFRQFTDANVGLRNTNIESLVIDNTAQDIELQVFLNQSDLWRSKLATGFLAGTYTSGGNVYKDGLLTVSIPANATAADRTDNILIEYFKGAVSTTIQIPVLQNA